MFFFAATRALKAIPFAFNSLTFSNLARNGCKCLRFINIVGSQRRGLSVPPAALRRNAPSVYHCGKYVKTNNVYPKGTSAAYRRALLPAVGANGIRPRAHGRAPLHAGGPHCSLFLAPCISPPTFEAAHCPLSADWGGPGGAGRRFC